MPILAGVLAAGACLGVEPLMTMDWAGAAALVTFFGVIAAVDGAIFSLLGNAANLPSRTRYIAHHATTILAR